MTATDRSADGRIRETYEVSDDGQRAVATIADPENGQAWIRSDLVQPIDR